MTKTQERLLEALDFLAARADSLANAAPRGREEEYRAGAIWYPSEPVYSWSSHYGDFTPATMVAGVKRGLIEEPRKHAYKITPAGRAFLDAAKVA
jgi:hypothetical protein